MYTSKIKKILVISLLVCMMAFNFVYAAVPDNINDSIVLVKNKEIKDIKQIMKLAVKPEQSELPLKILNKDDNIELKVFNQVLEKKKNVKTGAITEEGIATIISIYKNPYKNETSFKSDNHIDVLSEIGWLTDEGYDGSISVYGYAKFHYYRTTQNNEEFMAVDEYRGYYEIVDESVTVSNPQMLVFCDGSTLDGGRVSNERRSFKLVEGVTKSFVPPWKDEYVHISYMTGHACKVTLTCKMGTRTWNCTWEVQEGLQDVW